MHFNKFRQLGLMIMISHVWYSRHKCSACWPWHKTDGSREHGQCVRGFSVWISRMKLTHSDIKAWNSSAHFHVRHSLIAVLTMWFYNGVCDARKNSTKFQTSPWTSDFNVFEKIENKLLVGVKQLWNPCSCC